MIKLYLELEKYTDAFKEFKVYLSSKYKFNVDVFIKDSPNTVLLPQLLNFLEEEKNVNIVDAIVYVIYNNVEKLSFNDTCKKCVKVVFYKLEHKHPLDFTIF